MKLIIFDFDGTMTRFHTTNYITQLRRSYRKVPISQLVDYLLDHNPKEEILCDLLLDHNAVKTLRFLKTSQKAKFAIATYGYRILVEKTIRKYKLEDLFDHILTPGDFGLTEGAENFKELSGKNVMIMHLLGLERLNRPDAILFDDSSRNTNAAHKQFYFAEDVSSDGLTTYHMSLIVNHVKGK